MLDRFHPPVEEYLEAIFSLLEEGVPVIQARLAERLDKAAPSVSEMLDRLEADNLIARTSRQIALTPTGAAVAEGVVRKHRLAERLLVDIIGLDWDKAHLEAGRWEHVISDEVEKRLVVLLDNPQRARTATRSPGRPAAERAAIPGQGPAGRAHPTRGSPRASSTIGVAVLPGGPGLTPGTTAAIQAKAPDGTLTLVVGDATIAVGPAMTQRMFIASA